MAETVCSGDIIQKGERKRFFNPGTKHFPKSQLNWCTQVSSEGFQDASKAIGQCLRAFDFADITTFKEIAYFQRNKLRVKQVACSNKYSIFLTDDGELFVCETPDPYFNFTRSFVTFSKYRSLMM